jgi:hypothetical protein
MTENRGVGSSILPLAIQAFELEATPEQRRAAE